MVDSQRTPQIDEFPATLRLAYERTRVAYERTMMAWTRTGTSLITFGFAVYKFFQIEISTADTKAPLLNSALVGPREFGLILIGIGLLSLLVGTVEHARDMRAIRRHYPDMPVSGTRLIAALIATLGTLALVAVIYRY